VMQKDFCNSIGAEADSAKRRERKSNLKA
jgi:hypothetical protein